MKEEVGEKERKAAYKLCCQNSLQTSECHTNYSIRQNELFN